jgi:hypothetical protein
MKSAALWALCFAVAAPDGQKIVVEHFAEPGGTNRATFLSKREGVLRVVCGGALASGIDQGEAFLAELLESSGLDAVAVGYEDLAAGGPDRRALLASTKIPFVCANVKGAGRPYVVKAIGGTKVALVGVTKIPSSRRGFELARGWSIESPAASLKAILPGLAKDMDLVVLIAAMDRVECAELLKEVPGIHAVLVPGAAASDPEPLKAGETWIVQSSAHPSVFSRTILDVDAGKVAGASNGLQTVELSEADRGRLRELFAKHKEGVNLERLLSGVNLAPPPAAVRETGPLTSLEPGKTQPVVVLRSDGSVEIRIESVRVVTELEGRKAPGGASWIVVRSEWRNLIPSTSAGGRTLDTAYSVAEAANNLYVVANGRTLVRLDAELSGGPGGLLTGRSIRLEKHGSTRLGDLVFPLAASGAQALDLQFYDFRHPPAVFPLLTHPHVAEEKPVVPVVKNEILEAGVFGVRRERGVAPEGMTVAVIDLRARSLATVEVEGKRVGVAGDIEDAWKGLRLATDGARESAPEPGLPASPRLLPGAMTGWEVHFLVPSNAVDLELRWGFPEMGLPDGRTLKPASITIPLAGKGAAPPGVCAKCGTPAGPSDKFCGRCGTKLGP